MLERIMKPDETLGVPEQNRGYYGGKEYSATKARVKDFQYENRVRQKTFASTEFAGAKAWNGKAKFPVTAANTGTRSQIPDLEQAYATKEMPVKNARESSREHGTREYATREFVDKGKSQKSLDQQSEKKAMTIDEVRELLNKNK